MTIASDIIAQIPPLPELREKPGYVTGLTFWETPKDTALYQTFTQHYNEPEWRFLERVECYWRRGCAAKLVRELRLEADQERALIRECWLKLPRPSELPRWPEFDYGEPPRRVASGDWTPNAGDGRS